eukprot:scaffold2870_cov92-Isochrysis_galbana.AAC.3
MSAIGPGGSGAVGLERGMAIGAGRVGLAVRPNLARLRSVLGAAGSIERAWRNGDGVAALDGTGRSGSTDWGLRVSSSSSVGDLSERLLARTAGVCSSGRLVTRRVGGSCGPAVGMGTTRVPRPRRLVKSSPAE